MGWHGYIVMVKPAVLAMAEWMTVLWALRPIFDQRAVSQQPCERLHWRFSLDRDAILIEAVFDLADLDVEDLARLCKYISVALGGKYSPVQVRDALRERVTLFSAGDLRRVSLAAAKAYLQSNAGDWESGELV